MDWRPYQPCCQESAAATDAAFCPSCGHPYLRCMAFAECHTLVSPSQACTGCVAPVLMVDEGAVIESKRGDRLSVPLILHNASPAGRPLWVKRIVKWDDGIDEPMALTWERIDSRTERRFALDTPPLADGGTHTLRVIIVVASRHKGVEEEYAFSAGLSIAVSSPDTRNVHQRINITGNQFGTGGMVHAPVPGVGASRTEAPAALQDRRPVPLERAEKYELDHGVRGYRAEAVRVPRHVEFTFSGFPGSDCPPNGFITLQRGRLAFGRNSRIPDPASNPVPNDVCLRAYDPRSGGVDEPATLAISRHHFDLVVVNDRLCVHARSSGGMQVNGNDLASGQILTVGPGDRIVPIPGRPDKVTVQVAFVESIGSIERVEITRVPPLRQAG